MHRLDNEIASDEEQFLEELGDLIVRDYLRLDEDGRLHLTLKGRGAVTASRLYQSRNFAAGPTDHPESELSMCNYQGYEFGAGRYPDSVCIDGRLLGCAWVLDDLCSNPACIEQAYREACAWMERAWAADAELVAEFAA